jgi:hypothetical protein
MWAAVVELLTDNLEGKGSNPGASWYREKFKKCRKKFFCKIVFEGANAIQPNDTQHNDT